MSIVAITGKSESGKTTITRLLQERNGLEEIVSYTTRPIRDGEIDGIDYKFVTVEEFEGLNLLERVEVGGNLYGLPADDFNFTEGTKLVIVEPHGLEQVREFYQGKVVAIYLECGEETRYERLHEPLIKEINEIYEKEEYELYLKAHKEFLLKSENVNERLNRDSGKYDIIKTEYVVNAELDIEEVYSIIDGIIRQEQLKELGNKLNGGE